MAIIAELITLWRLQTCVISIFPSSHLAHRLENASMGRVNLATAQPSLQPPFSKPFLSWSSPRPHSAALSPAGTLRCFSCSHRSSSALCSLWESGIPSLPPSLPSGGCRAWPGSDLAGAAVTCANDPPKEARDSLVTRRNQQKLICHFKPSKK